MESFRGYSVRIERVIVGGSTLDVLMPTDSYALLEEPRVVQRFEQDEYLPYWAALWPAALLLADVVATWPIVGAQLLPPTVLELGCGLGLVGLVAAGRGYRVTVSDYDEDALAFVAENARRNGLPPPAMRNIDWRRTYGDVRVDRILAADVLYERRHLQPVAQFVARHLAPGGQALLSDAQRSAADGFVDEARRAGLEARAVPVQRGPAGEERGLSGRIFEVWRAST